MNPRRLILRGGEIVTPRRVLSGGGLVLEEGRIAAILEAIPPLAGEDVVWVSGLIAPAFVDLHSDVLEREIRPRPSTEMPCEPALMEFDRKLAGHGIGTIVHGLCFTETDGDLRAHTVAAGVAATVHERAADCLVSHLLQARYEITDFAAAPTVRRLIEAGYVRMVSFMDHAPGGRQFGTVEQFVRYYASTLGCPVESVLELAREKQRRKREERDRIETTAAELARIGHGAGAVLASHDDAWAEDVAWARRLGVTISECPASLEALIAAREAGLHVVMGAPNALRGGSTSGNLSALEALWREGLDSLCSNSYPASLLHAVLAIASRGLLGLPEAFRLVTGNPARALGLEGEIGALEPGRGADVIVVGWRRGIPVVTRTFRCGREIYLAAYEPPPEGRARQTRRPVECAHA